MKHIGLDIDNMLPFAGKEALAALQKDLYYHYQVLINKTGRGNNFLGWMELPVNSDPALADSIEQDMRYLKDRVEVVVVAGIGGSYLGARAVIEALTNPFSSYCNKKEHPVILYAGHHLSESYMARLLEFLQSRSYALVVISKSGTTTEPAIAFRLLKKQLEAKHGKAGARERIIAITDKSRGALKSLADTEDYKTYVIPDDVGGRFSVLSPVGLLPIALAGINIRELLEGAAAQYAICHASAEFGENPAALYAACRNLLYRMGKPVEVLVNYEPSLFYMGEWWKQLFGESEGKMQRGIFPATVNFTTDLHSMGQYLQDGLRILFETVLSVAETPARVSLEEEPSNLDGLNFLAGTSLTRINHMAETGTLLAHVDGGVPVMRITIPELNAFHIGELLYFFEFACALSAYILEVNPFDQPGVEAYKANMFALLGKPGYENEAAAIRKRLNW
ncbi:MAG TPA: glucose-6-phosphate isomerase [Bacteroidales bacterium]|nr:glucose-6-phosphate isomerase [Bacteroidales bacterium]HSA44542.1 glucose-6-phosphate isomerase [Bacteroidales bacterium]